MTILSDEVGDGAVTAEDVARLGHAIRLAAAARARGGWAVCVVGPLALTKGAEWI